jgi:hypothetical protein
MWALAVLAIYVTPLVILGLLTRFWMRRHAVDLTDVHAQAGHNRRPRKVFLLGAWRRED